MDIFKQVSYSPNLTKSEALHCASDQVWHKTPHRWCDWELSEKNQWIKL